MENLRTQHKDLNTRFNQLSQVNDELLSRVRYLADRNGELIKETISLKKKLKSVNLQKKDMSTISTMGSSLSSDDTEKLQKQIVNLKHENMTLEAECKELKKKNNDLDAKCQGLNLDLLDIKGEKMIL